MAQTAARLQCVTLQASIVTVGVAMFECVLAVTILVYDLTATETAYRDDLGYQVYERASVSEAMAATWRTPAMVGRQYITMQPQSGAGFYLRFIESDPVAGYAPLKTDGWNATELLVRDPDAMAARLEDSAFTVIGAPYDLSSDGNVRAMQVQGPSGEVIYLTRIQGKRTKDYGSARSDVDRAFILVVGGRDHEALTEFYGPRFEHPLRPFGKARITVLSKALGLPPEETLYPMKLALLGNQFSIELDGYPSMVTPRPRADGQLPPGMSMVTFGVSSLGKLDLPWRQTPQALGGGFYRDRRAAVTTGPAGEWLEFVEGDDVCASSAAP